MRLSHGHHRRIILSTAAIAALVITIGPGAEAATRSKKKTPVTKARSKLWEVRGTTGKYTAYEGNQYTLKLTGITALTPADIKPGGTGKYPIPTGAVPVRIAAELTYVGPKDSNDLPASVTSLVAVDSVGKKYETYAGDDKAGGGECSQFGDVDSNGTRALVKGTPLTSGLCVVVPASAVGPTLLVNLNWINDPSGIWFKTTP